MASSYRKLGMRRVKPFRAEHVRNLASFVTAIPDGLFFCHITQDTMSLPRTVVLSEVG